MRNPEITIREGGPAPDVPPAPKVQPDKVAAHPTAKPGSRRLCIARGNGKNLGLIRLADSLDYDGLIAFLADVKRDGVTRAQYEGMTKRERDAVKQAVPWFVLGRFDGDRRTRDALEALSAVVLDIDGGTPELLDRLKGEDGPLRDYARIIHSTRSHTPENPRFRVVLPTKGDVLRDDYEPLARMVASWIDPTLESVDPKSFSGEQLWYRSAAGPDVEPVFHVAGSRKGPLPNKAKLLGWDGKALPRSKRDGAAAAGAGDEGDSAVGAELHAAAREARGEFDCDNPAEVERLRSAMRRIPADKRETWLWMCAALHHAFGGSAEGYELAREWSEGSDDFPGCPEKFDAADQERTWQGFNTKRGVAKRVGSIFYEARVNYGWTDPGRPRAGSEVTSEADWMSGLEYADKGKHKIANTLHNVTLVLLNDPAFAGVRFNTFKEQLVLTAPIFAPTVGKGVDTGKVGDPIHGDSVTENVVAAIGRVLSAPRDGGGYGIPIRRKHDLDLPLAAVGHERRFNSAGEWIAARAWDGKPRLRKMLATYWRAADTEYHAEVGLRWVVAMVTRVFEPGHKFDFVPTFMGRQGLRKSTALRTLTEQLGFAPFSADFKSIDRVIENTKGKVSAEMPELSSLKGASVNTVKAILSAESDTTRLRHTIVAKDYKRTAVFCATTNERKFLPDLTGNRRWWLIDLFHLDKDHPDPEKRAIDAAGLRRDREQLWAEAYREYLAMRAAKPVEAGDLDLDLPRRLRAEAERQQEAATVHDPESDLAALIAMWLDAPVPRQEAALGYRRDAADGIAWEGEGDPCELAQRDVTCVPDVIAGCFPGVRPGSEEYNRLNRRVGKLLTEEPPAGLGWTPLGTKRVSAKQVGREAARAMPTIGAWKRPG